MPKRPKLLYKLGLMKANALSTRISNWAVYECPECHDEMLCMPGNIAKGAISRCSKCYRNFVNPTNIKRIMIAKEEFAGRATKLHKGQYLYHKVDYVNARTHVTVICPTHGPWQITPDNHLRGYGCNLCACAKNSLQYRHKEEAPAILYYLYLSEYNLWKIGWTKRSVYERYRYEGVVYKELFAIEYDVGSVAYGIEQYLINYFSYLRYKEKVKVFTHCGNTELITVNIYHVFTYIQDYNPSLEELKWYLYDNYEDSI